MRSEGIRHWWEEFRRGRVEARRKLRDELGRRLYMIVSRWSVDSIALSTVEETLSMINERLPDYLSLEQMVDDAYATAEASFGRHAERRMRSSVESGREGSGVGAGFSFEDHRRETADTEIAEDIFRRGMKSADPWTRRLAMLVYSGRSPDEVRRMMILGEDEEESIFAGLERIRSAFLRNMGEESCLRECIDAEQGYMVGYYEAGLASKRLRSEIERHLLLCDSCFHSFRILGPIMSFIRGADREWLFGGFNLAKPVYARPARKQRKYKRMSRRRIMKEFFGKFQVKAALLLSGSICILIGVIWIFNKVTPTGLSYREPVNQSRVQTEKQADKSILLISPLGKIEDSALKFDWKMLTETEEGELIYSVQLADAGMNFMWKKSVDGSSITLPSENLKLKRKTRYFWKVTAQNEQGQCFESEMGAFEILK